jgi:hypothetical protein
MKSRMRKSLLFFVLFLSQFSLAINIRYIKNTYTILKPEYKHLSPANGPVWWSKGIIENMYTYGNVKLTTFLFHPVQGSFNVTRAPGSAATYFTPRTVGLLLGEIEKIKPIIQKIMQEKKANAWKEAELKKVQEVLKKNLANVLADDEGYKMGVAGYLRAIQGDKAKLSYFSSNQKGLIAAVVSLLEESGFFEIKSKKSKAIYPFYTPYDILLTFLLRKAEDIKSGEKVDKLDYKEYFEGLRIQLGDVIFTEQGLRLLDSEAWLHDAYDDSEAAMITYLKEISSAIDKANPLDVELLNQLYEKMVFAELSRPKGFPNLAQYRTSAYEGQPFPDCVDTTMRNLCNVAVFDAKTNTFNLAMIKNAHPDAACSAFYINELYKKATEIENPLVHEAWTHVVENRPYISYNRILRKKDIKVFCCAMRKNDSFHGFMLSTDALKGKAKGTIDISFEDGAHETFDLLEMNGHRFALVDAAQFAPFEIMPSLKNVIILMNTLFGLGLYENIEKVFFEENFNTTYFPMIAKRFDWSYKILVEDLDQNDYQKIEIAVDTRRGSFTLRLYLDFVNISGHGQLILVSNIPQEPYQKRIFDFVSTELVEHAKAKMLDTHSFLFDLFALYQESNWLILTIALFNDFDALKGFTYFTQHLQDPDVKLGVILSIVGGRDLAMYGLCAGLIQNLPVEGDFNYVSQVANLSSEELLSSKESKPIVQALIKLYDSMLTRPIDDSTLRVVANFVSNNNLFDEKAIDLVQKNIANKDEYTRSASLTLFEKLLKKGKGYTEALVSAKKLMGIGVPESARAVESEDEKIVGLRLFEILVEQNQGGQEAIIAAQKGLDEGIGVVLKLYTALVNKGLEYEKASQAALQFCRDANHDWSSVELIGQLVDKGHAYETAKKIIQNIGLKSEPARQQTLFLYEKLVEKGVGYEEALQAVLQIINDNTASSNMTQELKFMGVLVAQGQAYDEAIKLASSSFSDYWATKEVIELFGKLFERGQGFNQAVELATSNFYIFKNHQRSIELFGKLFERGQGFDQAVELASKGIAGTDVSEQAQAATLFGQLFKYNHGFDALSALFLSNIKKEEFSTALNKMMKLMAKLAEQDKENRVFPIVQEALALKPAFTFQLLNLLVGGDNGYELLKKVVMANEKSENSELKQGALQLKEQLKAKGVN